MQLNSLNGSKSKPKPKFVIICEICGKEISVPNDLKSKFITSKTN